MSEQHYNSDYYGKYCKEEDHLGIIEKLMGSNNEFEAQLRAKDKEIGELKIALSSESEDKDCMLNEKNHLDTSLHTANERIAELERKNP